MSTLTGPALDALLDKEFGPETRPDVVADRFGPTSTAMAALITDLSFYALEPHGLDDAERLASIAGLLVGFAGTKEGERLHLFDAERPAGGTT